MTDEHRVQPGGGEAIESILESRDELRLVRGIVDCLGVGVKGDGDGNLPASASIGDHAFKNRLVPSMYAVEVADGHHGRA